MSSSARLSLSAEAWGLAGSNGQPWQPSCKPPGFPNLSGLNSKLAETPDQGVSVVCGGSRGVCSHVTGVPESDQPHTRGRVLEHQRVLLLLIALLYLYGWNTSLPRALLLPGCCSAGVLHLP